jgi:hypothetical protein
MGEEVTSKELLNKVIRQNEELARKQFELSLQFAELESKQELRFLKIENYLKSDNDTNQEGAIEKIERIDKKLINLDTEVKVKSAKVSGFVAAIVTFIHWVVSQL